MNELLIKSLLTECIKAEIEVDDVQYEQMMMIYDDFNKEYLTDYLRQCGCLLQHSHPEPGLKLKLRVKDIDFDAVSAPVLAPIKVSKPYVMTEKRARSLEKRKYISSLWRGLSVSEKEEWKCRAREWNALNGKKSTGYNRYLSHMYKEMSSVPTSPEQVPEIVTLNI